MEKKQENKESEESSSEEEVEPENLSYKIIVIGNAGSGKT